MSCFTLEATDGAARAGTIRTAHGEIRTPAFMPVGTKGTVKTLLPSEVASLGADVILGNTYHLHFRPGEGVIEELGGLHAFTGWSGPIPTDSGGFQVFSLRDTLARVDDEGVTFRSVYDGSAARLTPEGVAEIQRRLGSDIAMCLDICPPADASRRDHESAVRRTAALGGAPGRRRPRRGAVAAWDRAGRDAPRPAGRVDRRDRRPALRRLRARGLAVGRAARRCSTRSPGPHRCSRRAAALLHGPRRRRGDPRGGRTRDRHVRLRPSDEDGPHRLCAHGSGAAQPAQRPLRARPAAVEESCGCPACAGFSRASCVIS